MEWRSRDELISTIPERSIPTYDTLSYDDFLEKHLLPNTPFILSPEATASWAAVRWRQSPLRPNLDALKVYGDHIVPVADTRTPQWGEFERSERPLTDVLDLWAKGDGDGLYVKDWHLIAEVVGAGGWEGDVYEVPECFRDDWLNPPFRPQRPPPSPQVHSASSASTSDFRFTYLGPPRTFTPLHRDVYASYSWSANVVGRKVWWLFPPDRLDRVKRNGELVFDVRSLPNEGGGMKVLQEEGEVIFVPSGWHHQVVNVDFCISINHNFLCSITLPRVFEALEEAQVRVEESILDVQGMIKERLGSVEEDGIPLWEREWVEEVQSLLERDAGCGWSGFWRTVLANVQAPPRPQPPMRDKTIRETIRRFRSKRENVILRDVLSIIDQVEQLLSPERA